MEFKITDLLDDMQAIPLDIPARTPVSENRVKELTMEKMRNKNEAVPQPRRYGRLLSKAALVAAVLICLSVTVLAAVGGYLPQLLSQDPEETVGYDNDRFIGSVSKNWDLGGWVMDLKADAAGPWGLTMVCTEWSGQAQTGTLTTDDAFWLERWNGSGYEAYLPEKAPAASGQTVAIQPNTTASWSICWEDSYGMLIPGAYRLGKTFRHTSDSGQPQELACYVKFRVFEEAMAAYYDRYTTALNALRDQHSWHITLQVFPETPNGYTSYSQEIWKSGENYLEDLRYLDQAGTPLRQSGTALRDGTGYRLTWADGSEIAQPDASVNDRRFDLWYTFLTLADMRISEISEDGNRLVFKESRESDSEADRETVLTLDEAGQIRSIHQYRISAGEKKLSTTLTVHDTDAAQIARIISD